MYAYIYRFRAARESFDWFYDSLIFSQFMCCLHDFHLFVLKIHLIWFIMLIIQSPLHPACESTFFAAIVVIICSALIYNMERGEWCDQNNNWCDGRASDQRKGAWYYVKGENDVSIRMKHRP